MRRSESTREAESFEIGPLRIDTATHAASLHGDRVTLRRLEFELLLHLASDPQRVFHKQELLNAVWGLPDDRHHAHARQPRQPPTLQAPCHRRTLDRQRVGHRLPADLKRARARYTRFATFRRAVAGVCTRPTARYGTHIPSDDIILA